MRLCHLLFSLIVLFAFSTDGKTQGPRVPLTATLKQSVIHSLLPLGSPAVVTEVTVRKDAILNRPFLYGASLQFAALRERGQEKAEPIMAISIGQTPAEFKIVDNRLRLVTDSRLGFESDVNHPARLIQEFVILSQNAEFLTFRADKASPVLSTLLMDPETEDEMPTRASWIRTLEFAAQDELFLIQSSVELMNGSVAEFMETLTPRERIVPEDVKPIFADPELNPNAARFRFLDAGDVYVDHEDERIETLVAVRFVPKANEAIRWWVTPNIPEEYLLDVKNSVEAWNRYSRAMGKTDLVRFEGRLPEGVNVGDPRYNIIVWDNIQEAGSAYESQAADPTTGVQSHSLIYLPYAWINIGKEYWENAAGTEAAHEKRSEVLSRILKNRKFMGRSLPVHCMDSAHLHISLESKQSPEEFARALLKGVLFHEVGHALGLDHNFKGSLSFDPDNANTLFSHSIMDYNQYNEEEAAFFDLDSADGPLLEYDRQIISMLYNEGKDVRNTDLVLPTCNDEEADSKAGGVDPLCVRYDIGTDPTKQALRSWDLLENKNASNRRMTSLPSAILRVSDNLPEASSITTVAAAEEAIAEALKTLQGTASIYVGGSANSLAYLGSQSLKSLYVYRPGILPAGYQEVEMRERALQLLEKVSIATQFPTATKEALQNLRANLEAWLLSTPAFIQLSDTDRQAKLGAILSKIDTTYTTLESSLLARARTRLAGALKYSPEAPLSFHSRNGAVVDVEALVIGVLEGLASAKAGELARPLTERAAAVDALVSYKDIPLAVDARARVKIAIQAEIATTTDARTRESLRKLAAAL